jgi:hypothetical protein
MAIGLKDDMEGVKFNKDYTAPLPFSRKGRRRERL